MQAKKFSDNGKYTDDDESDEEGDSNGPALVARCARNNERETNTFNIPEILRRKGVRAEESVCESFR